MTETDMTYAAKIMIGDKNWREASPFTLLAVLLFGKREVITHLGMASTIRWWRETPYLSHVREVRKSRESVQPVPASPTTPPPAKPKR